MSLTLIIAPVGEPISLDDAKRQVRQGTAVDDAYIGMTLIPTARDRAEMATGRALLTQTWELVLDRFPEESYIEIPKPPLVSVTSVNYYDTGGALRTMTVTTDYLVQAPAGPRCARGRIALPFATIWPITISQMGAVVIRFVCGYGATGDSVPGMLKQAMLLDVGTLYVNREGVVLAREVAVPLPEGVRDTYQSYRSVVTQRLAA